MEEKLESPTHIPANNVVSLNMFKLKKSLRKEGFEIVEDSKGKITLVVRVSK
jgi:hypothetical protein